MIDRELDGSDSLEVNTTLDTCFGEYTRSLT